LVLAVQTEAMNWQSKNKMTLESMREMDQLIHSLKMKNENVQESSEAARKVITHYIKTKIFPGQEKSVSNHVLTVSNYVELHSPYSQEVTSQLKDLIFMTYPYTSQSTDSTYEDISCLFQVTF